MVGVAGGEEGGFEPHGVPVAVRLLERVAVEGERAIEVGDLQVHVAGRGLGVDGFLCMDGSVAWRGAPVIGGTT